MPVRASARRRGSLRRALCRFVAGFFASWLAVNRGGRPVDRWLRELSAELECIASRGMNSLEVIDESLSLLGVTAREHEEYLSQTLLALRGWTGMMWQMETNAE